MLLTRTPQCDVPLSQVRHTVTRQTEKLLQSRASQNPGEFTRSTRQMPLKGVIMVTIFYLPHCQACLQSTRQATALPEETGSQQAEEAGSMATAAGPADGLTCPGCPVPAGDRSATAGMRKIGAGRPVSQTELTRAALPGRLLQRHAGDGSPPNRSQGDPAGQGRRPASEGGLSHVGGWVGGGGGPTGVGDRTRRCFAE